MTLVNVKSTIIKLELITFDDEFLAFIIENDH